MKIFLSDKSKKQLSKMDLRFQKKIIDSLEKYEKGENVDIKKLMGRKDEYRIRVGHYRIIMTKISDKEFLVSKIGERKNIYLIFL